MVEPGLRACLAFIVGRLVRRGDTNAVFDRTRSLIVQFHAEFEQNEVFLFDYVRRCHVTVSGDGQTFTLHDFGTRGLVALTIDDSRFNGFDHLSRQQFHGSVTGDSVTFSLPGSLVDDHYELRFVEP